LKPPPIPDRPNLRIHADLFGPMITAKGNKKFVLCITEAFTKYAVDMAISNKDADTVANAIFKDVFASLEFWHKFTLMAEKNTSTKFRPNFFNLSTSATLKLHLHILSATLK
jgi:hypothetical protein